MPLTVKNAVATAKRDVKLCAKGSKKAPLCYWAPSRRAAEEYLICFNRLSEQHRAQIDHHGDLYISLRPALVRHSNGRVMAFSLDREQGKALCAVHKPAYVDSGLFLFGTPTPRTWQKLVDVAPRVGLLVRDALAVAA